MDLPGKIGEPHKTLAFFKMMFDEGVALPPPLFNWELELDDEHRQHGKGL